MRRLAPPSRPMHALESCALALATLVAGVPAQRTAHLAPGRPPSSARRGPQLYEFDIAREQLIMRDGVRLAVTWWLPRPRTAGERFPVLFEYLPYRKDDSFYQRDWPLYSWFVRRGFIMAKVDVRGTGGSQGVLPEREYSDIELADGAEVVAQLARVPAGNGRVGMWGISWGAFNALMLSARGTPGLSAILALHGSDDLFHDDVHYVDGIFHLDPYQLEIDHENGLPRTPDYPLDSAYFADRFDRPPWLLIYLAHAVDGPFWRDRSIRFLPVGPRVPAYLIGGLFDGYRDTPLRLLARARAPMRVEIGPWEHAWPDNGVPGPGYEWRERAVQWWDRWLRDDTASAIAREPPVLLFVRDWNAPDVNARDLAGSWRTLNRWPPRKAAWADFYLSADGRLSRAASTTGARTLAYDPTSGLAGGDWWGDRTGDMGADDAGALVFDSAPLATPITIVGTPTVSLAVSSPAPLANWIARLEDVAPDGRASLVTGGAIAGAQIAGRLTPARITPGARIRASFELHVTTWTFRPGHRVRLAVTNAQFPMLWPTPSAMTTALRFGTGTVLRLPAAPPMRAVPAGLLPPPEPRDSAPDARTLDDSARVPRRVIVDVFAGTTRVELTDDFGYAIGERRIHVREFEAWETSERDPARAAFVGLESHRIELPARTLLLESLMDVRGDSAWLRVTFTRRISENGRLVRERVFADSARRDFH